ncbi:minor tail protein [Arthrobacter phage Andrew]|uniref:Minor tail protein n=1 Tax=Arthrobacter phage Andrew TaxID=2419946 RepID=A0A3G2KCU3_9CAUD|nr:minor tail protein [Arthrobacter phage Andrew]AYN56836.1 minor tail protein [Arthrobacter phage Andrew]
MAIQTFNKTTVPVGSDPYALTADLKKLAEGLNVIIPVATVAERDALVPFEGMTVSRLDQKGQLDRYINGAWTGLPVEYYSLLSITGYETSGQVMLERKGGRKVLSGNIQIKRTAANTTISGTAFASFGQVIPTAACIPSGQGLYLAAYLSGNAAYADVQAFVNPIDGTVSIRGAGGSGFTWPTGALFTVCFVAPSFVDGI